jgi:NAD(P)-dependent dehydrogenase (short-subunit alcohol dehydrogenase family)
MKRYLTQAASSGKRCWNSIKERGKSVTASHPTVYVRSLFYTKTAPTATTDCVTGRRGISLAGVTTQTPLGKITEELYDSIFNINVKGLLFTVQKALPLMPEGASIILNASIVASKGMPAWSIYSATKAAVRSFARTWTTDLKDRRIRVNAVSPGFIDTPPWHATEAAEQSMKVNSNAVPLGRYGTADEIAQAVVFLASDESSYVTGVELFVDGGFAQV